MLRNFIKLERKSFVRSAGYNMNLVSKILLGIVGGFYSLMFLFLGVAAFYALKEEGLEPLSTVNQYLIYWWAGDLVIRYFLQKSPVMRVRPLLTMPIRRSKIVNYLLGKSAFSFFNMYPAFFFLPFSISLLINGYDVLGVITWGLGMLFLTLFNNYLNLAINNKDSVFIGIAVLFASLGTLHYFEFIDIQYYATPIFQSFYDTLFASLILVGVTVLLYGFNFNYFYKALYLDDAVQTNVKEVNVKDYSWLERYGLIGVFLKNDLRLILRNKRSKNALWTSVFFLFYGFLILTSPTYENSDAWLIFAGIFSTGGFIFIFGGFVPSWDSSYYQFMMSQNIQYKEYLASKWWLMTVATIFSILICTIYLILGVEYYLAILVCGIYNIGVNGYITLLSGAYVKTPIDLSSGKKPFGDKKSFNFKTILLTIPKILLPIGVFYLFAYLFDRNIGLLSIALLGIIGLAFRNYMFRLIERVYKTEKYSTIQAYTQKN